MSQPVESKRRIAGPLLVLGVAVLISVLFAIFLKEEAAPRPKRGGLGPGNPMPEIRADGWLNGPAPAPTNLKGRVLVVDAWASWCGPCLREAPHLVEAYKEYHGRGVEFIGLSGELKSDVGKMQTFIDDAKIPWPCGYGQAAQRTLFELDTEFIPQVWVVGVDGKIRWNLDSKGSLSDALEEALAAANSAEPSSNKSSAADRSTDQQKGKP